MNKKTIGPCIRKTDVQNSEIWTGPTLVHVMACRPMLIYSHLDPWEPNSNQNTKIFIHENAFENVDCGMAAILSWGDKLNRITFIKGEVLM